jgi:nitrate/TMAO reductase-like tetraheme cytochrome c subunit
VGDFKLLAIWVFLLLATLSLCGCGWDPAVQPSAGEQVAEEESTGSVPTTQPMFMDNADDPYGYDAHEKLFVTNRFPSATQCGQCHPTQYRQWSVSQHAYAQVSPIFNSMQAKITKGTNGTNGDFCVRCHTQVGMNLGEATFMSNVDRSPTSREGITCIICHRVPDTYGKISGRFRITEGPISDHVRGPTGNNAELNRVIAQGGLQTDPKKTGRQVHAQTEKFFRMTTSAFCGSCHDVTLLNGFRLEEAFSEYKHSPAALRGLQCQDCHMGKEPGRALADKSDPDFDRKNFAFGPAAKVGSMETKPRMLTNHMFVGPDYSVVSPAIFPLNIKAIREESEKNDPKARGLATIRDWMLFDWKAGWGTDAFENNVPANYQFPARWASSDDRYDGRAIIDDNLKLLAQVRQARLKLLRNGYVLGDVKTIKSGTDGIEFSVQMKSGTDGHNVPTGFDAERLVWIHVKVTDAAGKVIKESGDLDPNGDVRDELSAYVHNGELPLDTELFSLQGHFIDRLQRGGERLQVLTTNFSLGPLPFLRPSRFADILLGRPGDARKQKQSIEALGVREPHYKVDATQLTGHGPYTALVQIKAAMVPVNLVNEVQTMGFDYGMSPRQVADNLVAGHQVVWERRVVLGQ